MVVHELITRLGFTVDSNVLQQFNRQIDQARTSSSGTTGVIRGLAGAFAGFLATIGAGALGGSIIRTNANFESLTKSLESAMGSAEAGKAAFDTIEKFAASTPYDLNQVTEGFIKLKNLGLDPSEEALTSYG